MDPAVADPLFRQLKALGAELTAIFNTHQHSDHVGGNQTLIEHWTGITVYAGGLYPQVPHYARVGVFTEL
ncbi:MBL fold metallo-hydrolase [Laspinema sp. A4]|uniref:MBL fold metallo-hydrolase n=1 Tax=Laspinema sp. D2d TaxID=2953686 RepID=UPI0021BB7D9F|nr:MBL fold metallo-hydrolase [Laspinema sp. D2d]MCT7985867.1 MBL fold metallo-hydrolase [Laspinema sp. D2d]